MCWGGELCLRGGGGGGFRKGDDCVRGVDDEEMRRVFEGGYGRGGLGVIVVGCHEMRIVIVCYHLETSVTVKRMRSLDHALAEVPTLVLLPESDECLQCA